LAYRGWLVSTSHYLADLAALRRRWSGVIAQLGGFPGWPVRLAAGPAGPKPQGASDITDAFVSDFATFYDNWELQTLLTWDLPLPRGANLSGVSWPASVAVPPSAVALHVSAALSLPSDYPLHEIVREAQAARGGEHLAGWRRLQARADKGDVGYLRLRRMFLVHFYRDVALASRYGERYAGNVEALDRAMGHFLGVGEDSVKKLRLGVASRRSGG
jgi:hypothetical protein